MTPGLARAIRRLGDVLYNKYSPVDDPEGIVSTSNTLKLHRVRISMTLSSISRVFISNPSATRAQKYALLSPKLCKYSHSLPKDPTSWFSYWLPSSRASPHASSRLPQATVQDVVLLMLRKFYTYVEALTAFSLGGRPVLLRLSSLALNYGHRRRSQYRWAQYSHCLGYRVFYRARPTIKCATVD